jgi:hypothetical protein
VGIVPKPHRKPNNTYTVSTKVQYKNEKPIMPNSQKVYFSIGLWNCSDSVALLVFPFSIGL